MLLMLIVLRNRGDNEIMRAAKAALSIIVASSSSCFVVVRAQGNRSRGGQKHAPRLYRIYGAPTLAPKDSCPITGYPAWPPVVLLLVVPTLTNGPRNGPWAQNRFNNQRNKWGIKMVPYCMYLNMYTGSNVIACCNKNKHDLTYSAKKYAVWVPFS